MKSFKEYQERKDAQRFFRENNNYYLSKEQWITLIMKGLLSAVVIGVIHGMFIRITHIDLSLLYAAVGLAIANILTTSSQTSSHQIGVASVICTLVAYYVSFVVLELSYFNLSTSLVNALLMFIFNDLFTIIFMVLGLAAAYLQGKEERFM